MFIILDGSNGDLYFIIAILGVTLVLDMYVSQKLEDTTDSSYIVYKGNISGALKGDGSSYGGESIMFSVLASWYESDWLYSLYSLL